MANGNFFGSIKSRFGSGSNNRDAVEEDYEYEEYSEYEDEYEDDYEDREDDRGEGHYTTGRDPYMDRSRVTTRGGSASSDMPRLVSMTDARQSARSISPARGARLASTSSIRSYGRTMVDSSLPPTMTAEGSAAVSAASNRRAEGLDSLFSSSEDRARSLTSSKSTSSSKDLIRNSMQLSMPGQRQLLVIRPNKYDDAEAVTNVLKSGDAAIIVFTKTDRALMMRILDFSFGAASALDAIVECIGNGVFAICRNAGLDDQERQDLKNQGII